MRRAIPALVCLSSLLFAQEEVGRPYWVSTRSDVAGALATATELIAREDWDDAARKIHQIFHEWSFEFVSAGRDGPYVGVRGRAVELLAQAPAALADAYERLYGQDADRALREALAEGDAAALLGVVRTFEGTQAGLRAVLALADRALLRGRPAEARLLLARVHRLHPDAAERKEVQRRAALAAARDEAEGGPPPRGWETAAEAIRLPSIGREAWPMMGGDATRCRLAPPMLVRPIQHDIKLDLRERLWDHAPRPSQSFRFERSQYDGAWERRWRDYNPIYPVISRGTLVYHDGRQVHAHNLYTGEEKWRVPRVPWIDSDLGRTNLSSLFSPVVSNGVVYAAIEVSVPHVPQRLQNVPITYYIPQRRLLAIDLESGEVLWKHDDAALDGKEGGALLRQLSITAPPLVRGDRLYAPATRSEGTFHYFVVAVDRNTGDLVYATPISTGQQELNLFGRQLQECAATPVAEADGVLYFGTNLGIFAAVDALLGTPLWAAPYPIVSIPSTFLWFEAPRRWPRFDNGPPLIAGDTVITAPTDANQVFVFQRTSGRLLWSVHASGREAGLDFAPRSLHGVDEKHLYLGGPDGVAALRLEAEGREPRGSLVWQWTGWKDKDQEDEATGPGLLTEDGIWVPTYAALYRFDGRTGKVRERVAREGHDEEVPVHLTWGDGVLLTTGREFLCARYEESDVIRLAKARVQAEPDEVAPLLSAADIYLATGQVSQAIAHYRRARMRAEAEGVPAAVARANEGLFRALLAQAEATMGNTLEKAPAEFETAFRAAPDARARLRARVRLETLLAGRSRPAESEWRLRNLRAIAREHGRTAVDEDGREALGWALRRMAKIYLEEGRTREAIEVLQSLLERDPDGPDGRHANRVLRHILETEGRALYAPYEKRATQLFATALKADDLDTLERGLLLYANSEAATEATLELARRRLRDGDPAAATHVLQRFLLERQGSPRTPDALLLMVQALDARESYGPAYSALHRLRSRHGNALVTRADGARVPAREVADAWLAREPYRALAHSARRRELEPGLVEKFRQSFPRAEAFVDVPDLLGERPAELAHAVVLKAGGLIVAVDTASGNPIYELRFDEHEPSGPLVFVGRRLLVATSRRVHVFDAVTGRALVQRAIEGKGLRLIENNGQVFLLFREGEGRGRMGVSALHPDDATTLWTQTIPTTADEELVIARHAMASADRLLLFSEHPVQVIVIDSTSGAVENRIPVDDARNSRIAVPPVLLPDGRLVLGLGTREKGPRFTWEHSYEVVLVDPLQTGDGAVLWRYRPPRDDRGRYPRQLSVVGGHVAVLDESRGAAVVDLRDGREVRFQSRLFVTDALESRPHLTANQPRHDSLLLVLTGPTRDEPARLSGYELPDLRLKYSEPVADSPREIAEAIDSDGVLGISIIPQEQGASRARIRLFDPLTARALQEIEPGGRPVSWFTARVQNGVLVVTTANNVAYGYAPK